MIFATVLAAANAGVIPQVGVITQSIVQPAVKSTHIQGPGTSTHIIGPDGSQIISNQPGAVVRTDESVGLQTDIVSPVVEAKAIPVVEAAPIVEAAAPVVEAVAPVETVVAPADSVFIEAKSAPVLAEEKTIVSTNSVVNHAYAAAAPVVAAPIIAKTVVAQPVVQAAPVLAQAPLIAAPVAPIAYAAFPAGHGIEGQYIPDNLEKLYDDGSYKGEIY